MIPLISIIVPCFNQAQFLDECLQSVMNQNLKEWECIIVNDGSHDHTEAVAKIWTKKDARFKYVYKENGGLSSARNEGIKNAVGEFILPLDADDKISNNYAYNALQVFEHDLSVKLIYCNAEKFGAHQGLWDLRPFTLSELAIDNMIFCSAIYKKREWELIGGYDEKLIHGLEDWEFWISLLKNGGKVIKLEEIGFFYRVKENSMILNLNNNTAIKKSQFDYISVKHADFFVVHKGSFFTLENRIKQLERDHYKNVTNKKKAFKIFLKVFFGVDYFKD